MLNLAVFKKIASAAALAGLLAGLLLTGLQRIHVIPAILEAEVHEQAAAPSPSIAHSTQSSAQHGDEHHHHGYDWEPANGLERTAFTALANVSVAVGFALLLGAAMLLRGGASGWCVGLLWGAAGYAVFFLAPSIGLPPELPGTEAASLAKRQLWWLLTVAATAAGVALLIVPRNWKLRIAGFVLLGIPHLVGAPQPEVHGSTAPIDLANSFIYATAITNAVFWLALGGLTGFFYRRAA